MKQYKALLLDLDNTLYNYAHAHAAGMTGFCNLMATYCGIDHYKAKEAFEIARKDVNQRLQGTAASHNRLLYMQAICEHLNLNAVTHALTLYNAYWDAFLAAMILLPNAKTFLDAWVALGKSICIVTDLTAHIQFRKLERLSLQELITFVVTSEEVGHEKPHPEMFLTALRKLKLNANEVVFIGDDFQKDIKGAESLQIETLQIAHDNVELQHSKIVSFHNLLEMLNEQYIC